MSNRRKRAGYKIDEHRFSPHQFGIPQIRERIYIVGCRDGLDDFAWPAETPDPNMSIVNALETQPEDARQLPKFRTDCLDVWQEFVQSFPKHVQLPSFPIWSMEFGATYPYEKETPHAVGPKR